MDPKRLATAREVLRGASARIERGWTQRAIARNRYGSTVISTSPQAVCWCSSGAILVTAFVLPLGLLEYDDACEDAENLLRRAIRAECGEPMPVTDWNDADGRTKAEVLAVFDAALALAPAVNK
jgi:hypothetical protein